MLKQRLIAAISAAMLFALTIPVITHADYSDVPEGAWYAEYLTGLTEKNAINGYEDGTFKPDKTVTVAEFVKTLVSLTLGEPTVTVEGHWAQKYINEAIGKGIAASNLDGYDEPISRGLMAQLLDNATVYALEEEILSDTSAASQLKDWDALGDMQKSVAQCYCKGLIGGYEDGEFKADNKMTRAEMCAVLIRLVDESQRLENVTSTPEPTPEVTAEPAMVHIKYIDKDGAELSEPESLAIEAAGTKEIEPANLKASGYRAVGYSVDSGEEEAVIAEEMPVKLDVTGEKDHNVVFRYESFPENYINGHFNFNTVSWPDKVSHFKRTEDGSVVKCNHEVKINVRCESEGLELTGPDGKSTILSGQALDVGVGKVTLIAEYEMGNGSIRGCGAMHFDVGMNMPVYEIYPPVVTLKLPFQAVGEESGPYAGKKQFNEIELVCKDDSPFAFDGTVDSKTYEYEMYIPEDQRIIDENKISTPVTLPGVAGSQITGGFLGTTSEYGIRHDIAVKYSGKAFARAEWDIEKTISFWSIGSIED